MELSVAECAICGHDAPDDREFECAGCGRRYHVGCAVDAGQLHEGSTERGPLGGPTVNYDWSCPDCGRESEERLPA